MHITKSCSASTRWHRPDVRHNCTCADLGSFYTCTRSDVPQVASILHLGRQVSGTRLSGSRGQDDERTTSSGREARYAESPLEVQSNIRMARPPGSYSALNQQHEVREAQIGNLNPINIAHNVGEEAGMFETGRHSVWSCSLITETGRDSLQRS